MKTIQQHRQDAIKRMEGERPTLQYIEEACYRDTGDIMMVLQEYTTPEFASRLQKVFDYLHPSMIAYLPAQVDELRKAYHDMVKRYASQFEDESDE